MRACLLFVTACGRLEFGATGDGGVDDDGVSATDDTSDSGAPAYMCPALKYKLCDELDTPTLGSLWTTTIGSVTRDTNIVHRGASSLRLSMPQTQPMAQTAAYIEHFSAWIQNATEVCGSRLVSSQCDSALDERPRGDLGRA